MAKGFGEASICKKNSSKHLSLLPAQNCEEIQKQLASHFEELKDPKGEASQHG